MYGARVSRLLFFLCAAPAFAQPLVLEGDLPTTGPDFVLVPFTVPVGTVELEVRHPVQQSENILDYGLSDPSAYVAGAVAMKSGCGCASADGSALLLVLVWLRRRH